MAWHRRTDRPTLRDTTWSGRCVSRRLNWSLTELGSYSACSLASEHSGLRNYRGHFAMLKRPIVSLMYHELELPGRSICQNEPGYARYVLPESEFRSQIRYLKKNGWNGLSVGQSLGYPEGRSVTITFDDGCETDLLAAAPLLKQAGFNATFFITSGK